MSIADWMYALNRYQIAFLVVAVGVVLLALAALSWLFVYGAMSGAGEANPEEVECKDDICAWCYPEQPHMKARGIRPHHQRVMVEQARECQRANTEGRV